MTAARGFMMVKTIFHRAALFDFVLITLFIDETNCVLFIVELVILMPILFLRSSAGDQIDAQECQDAATCKLANPICGCRLEITI